MEKRKRMGQEKFESNAEFYQEHVSKILPKCPWCGIKKVCLYTRNPNGIYGDIMRLSCKSCGRNSKCRIEWG